MGGNNVGEADKIGTKKCKIYCNYYVCAFMKIGAHQTGGSLGSWLQIRIVRTPNKYGKLIKILVPLSVRFLSSGIKFLRLCLAKEITILKIHCALK